MGDDTSLMKARDLAERAGLPEADVKRYLRTYGEFFTSVKQGRTRFYPQETAGMLSQISELEAMGTTAPTIRGILRGDSVGKEKRVEAAPGIREGSVAIAGEHLTLGVLSDVKSLQEAMGDLRAQVAMLRDKVTEQEQKLIGHQQQIRLLRHDVDEQKTDGLARRMEERNIPFWKRLFGRKGA